MKRSHKSWLPNISCYLFLENCTSVLVTSLVSVSLLHSKIVLNRQYHQQKYPIPNICSPPKLKKKVKTTILKVTTLAYSFDWIKSAKFPSQCKRKTEECQEADWIRGKNCKNKVTVNYLVYAIIGVNLANITTLRLMATYDSDRHLLVHRILHSNNICRDRYLVSGKCNTKSYNLDIAKPHIHSRKE